MDWDTDMRYPRQLINGSIRIRRGTNQSKEASLRTIIRYVKEPYESPMNISSYFLPFHLFVLLWPLDRIMPLASR